MCKCVSLCLSVCKCVSLCVFVRVILLVGVPVCLWVLLWVLLCVLLCVRVCACVCGRYSRVKYTVIDIIDIFYDAFFVQIENFWYLSKNFLTFLRYYLCYTQWRTYTNNDTYINTHRHANMQLQWQLVKQCSRNQTMNLLTSC